MAKTVEIQEGKHFSKSGLAEFLNKEFNSKKSGKKFTRSDVQQYIKRGNIPSTYGGHNIREIKIKYFGVFVEVDFKIENN